MSCPARRHLHRLVDVQDAAVDADVERPARGHADHAEHAVGGRRGLGRVGEDRVVGLDVLGELGVGLGVVDADREVGHLERPNGVAALTERLALDRSTTGEGLGEPGQDDRAACRGSRRACACGRPIPQRERRRLVADLELHGGLRAARPPWPRRPPTSITVSPTFKSRDWSRMCPPATHAYRGRLDAPAFEAGGRRPYDGMVGLRIRRLAWTGRGAGRTRLAILLALVHHPSRARGCRPGSCGQVAPVAPRPDRHRVSTTTCSPAARRSTGVRAVGRGPRRRSPFFTARPRVGRRCRGPSSAARCGCRRSSSTTAW